MIKKVSILVVLCLSVIFIGYIFLSSKNDIQPVTLGPSPPSEEVVSTTTENARDIDTIPAEPEPEEEDPGTCEITGSWAMVGTCNADGTAKYTQTYKESKPGACPSSVKADFKPCCYQKGDWEDITECNEIGKKTQKQTTVNCAENFKTREVDCPYIGPWRKTGECNSSGKQYYVRDVINSTESREKTENCCYEGTWSGWGAWGDCDGSTRSRIRTKTPVNCPADTPTSETETQTCNHCAGEFVEISRRDGCFLSTPYIYIDQEYRHITPATNGGNLCPFEHGLKLTKSVKGGNADCCIWYCD